MNNPIEDEANTDADRSAPCTGARLGTRGDGQQAWFVRLSSLDELLAFVAARLMPVTIEPDPYTEGEMMAEIRDLWS